MTRKGKTSSASRGSGKKLKLKKETIRDLGAKGKGAGVKGGRMAGGSIVTCTCFSCVFTCACKAQP